MAMMQFELFGFFRKGGTLFKFGGYKNRSVFIGDGIAGMQIQQIMELRGAQAGFFCQFTLGAQQEGLTDGATALDDFPGIGMERVPVLSNQIGKALGIDGHDTDRHIFKGNDTINAGVSGGI